MIQTTTIIGWLIAFLIEDEIRQRKLRKKKNAFNDALNQVEDAIMQSDRNNRFDAIKTNDMIEYLEKLSFCKYTSRQTEQMIIFWKSKFKHLFV